MNKTGFQRDIFKEYLRTLPAQLILLFFFLHYNKRLVSVLMLQRIKRENANIH